MSGRIICKFIGSRGTRLVQDFAMAACLCLFPLSGLNAAESVKLNTAMPVSIPEDVVAAWELRDNIATVGYAKATASIAGNLPPSYGAALAKKAAPASSKEAYLQACHAQRVAAMEPVASQVQQILYAKHYDLGGGIIGSIEDLNGDGYTSPCTEAKFNLPGMSKGSKYSSGSALMIVTMSNGVYGTPAALLTDAGGVVRDPCLSYDAKKVVFAWSKDNNGYHIYEIDIASKVTTELTRDDVPGNKVSDFEPCYLPNGDIVFNSSRVFGTIDCNFPIVSNLFIMNGQGKYMRRIGFDQVSTFYPTMMSSGKVLYSRWEYNDRNVSNVFGIFTMNIDGSHQTEYYGNQTSTPATLPQAREIPGTNGKVLATTAGHMGPYCGALCVIDPNLARNGQSAAKLICPSRNWPSGAGMDGMPDAEKLYQNPYPLDATKFLISYRASTSSKFEIYLMSIDGATKELIASDASKSVSQPIPLVARPQPPILAYQVDYTQTDARAQISNAYYGQQTGTSVKAATIKKLRVVALEYRIFPWFGNTGASAYTSTPIARWMGSWEAKRIVGEMPVESDGSCAMLLPTRTPLYFQLIDASGCIIQSMRSWSTLQPGEKFACYGCHEDKNASPPTVSNPIAATPKPLNAFYDVKNDYLSFPRYIQPLLDKNCVSCHKAGHSSGLDLSGTTFWTGTLTSDNDNKTACRNWSNAYYNLTTGIGGFSGAGKYVNFITVMSGAEGLKPNTFGSTKSAVITKLKTGTMNGQQQSFPAEVIDKIAAWIDLCICYSGFYTEGMKPSDSTAYLARLQKTRGAWETVEAANIKDWIASGQYTVPPYSSTAIKGYPGGKGSATVSAMDLFTLKFSLDGRRLTATNIPCKGTLLLMDLSGRRIMAYELSRGDVVNTAIQIPLRTGLPRGLYIVKFAGAAGTNQRIFAVL